MTAAHTSPHINHNTDLDTNLGADLGAGPARGISYWLIAFVLGSLVNLGLFLFLPLLGRTEPPAPPQIIKLEFLAWQQPVQQKKAQPKKPIEKVRPKEIIKKEPKQIIKKSKPKPKPEPKTIPKPAPKPVLAEKVIPDKTKPIIKPTEVIEEPVEPIVPTTSAPEDAKSTDEALPTPTPIFQLTQLPRMIHREKPIYPPDMKQQGKEGTVKLEVLLDVKGKIRKVTIKKSAGAAFDQAAINAIQNSSFMPANVSGKPVAVLMKIPVKFRLR